MLAADTSAGNASAPGTGTRSPSYLPAVESLRGLATLLVFVYHADRVLAPATGATVTSPLLAFGRAGHTGAAVFFVLTGFLLSRPFLAEVAGGPRVRRRSYYLRRALRIVPPYYLAVLVATLASAADPGAALRSWRFLLFLPVPPQDTPWPYGVAWWTVATIAQFSVLLPLLPVLARARWRAAAFLALYAGAYGAMLVGPLRAWEPSLHGTVFGYGPLFLSGILAAWIYERRGQAWRARLARGRFASGMGDVVVVLLVAGLGFLLRAVLARGFWVAESGPWFAWHVVEGLLWTGVLLVLLLAPLGLKPLLVNPALGALGRVSYSFFLVHVPVLVYTLWYCRNLAPGAFTGWHLAGAATVVGIFAGCLLLSALLYAALERPLLAAKAHFPRHPDEAPGREDAADPRVARAAVRWPAIPAAVYLLVALALPAAVYYPIVDNYFHADDFLNLESIANDPVGRYVLQPSAGHILIARNALFYLFYQAFGARPEWYFAAVLLTHLLNVGLLFAVLRRLGGSRRLACFGAALWGISPVAEGSLGWYAVYGHVVAATLLLLVLYRVSRLLEDDAPLTMPEACLWYGLVLVAATAFGVGIGIALTFPAVVFLLFPGERTARGVRVLFLTLPPLVLAGYVGLHWVYHAVYGGDAKQTPLTLIPFLWMWQSVAGMFVNLLGVAIAASLGSFALPLASYPNTLAYVLIGLYGVLLVGLLVAGPPRTRRLVLALAVIALGTYAIIAAGRAGLYAAFTVHRAYAAAELRYHYVGLLPVCIVLCLGLSRLAGAVTLDRRAGDCWLLGWILLSAFLYWRSGWQIDHHVADRRTATDVLQKIQSAIDEAPPGEPVYITNQPFPPALFQAPYFAGWAGAYTIYFPRDTDRRVRFVEPNPDERAVGPPGSRLSAVMVPAGPGSPPPSPSSAPSPSPSS